MLDYLSSKFNVYLDDHCLHLLDKPYKTQIKRVQNISVVMFFLLVHIPLS
jgi:hypothetical protein